MIKKFVTWMMTHRFIVIAVIAAITLFFAWQVRRLEVKTFFDDLLPRNHPYIEVYEKYEEQLGDPLKVILAVQVKEGSIYNHVTLKKIIRVTSKLHAIPGVNHNQVYSIASRKIKRITATADAIITENLMDGIPDSREEMEAFRETVRNTGGVYGVWVSFDEKAALFTASFISERFDYNVLFKKINEIIESETDTNHIVYATGDPVLTGWVYHYQQEMYLIFGVTFLALFLLLFLYFRNLVGILAPILSTMLGAIWGLGFCGLLGFKLEPLTLVLPLLITARALSHSVQITERYFECFGESKEVIPACIDSASSILPPGLLGILTDGIGIFLIAVAPIPVMQKLAFLCGFWAISIIFTGLIFTPLIISFFRPVKNISKIVDVERGLTQKILGAIARFGYGRLGVATFAGAVVLAGVTGYIALSVGIGDVNPGSPILWQDSEYNIAINEINKKFPGTEELHVIVEGDGIRSVAKSGFMRILNGFQRHMEKSPNVTATLSIADFLPPIQKAVFAGYPKMQILPKNDLQCSSLLYLVTGTASPGDFDRYFSRELDMANVIIWYKDHMGETIRTAIDTVKDFIDKNQARLTEAKVELKLASGNLSILAAVNEVVAKAQLLNFVLVMGVILVLCSFTYRSVVAAAILLIPLNLANLVTLSVMKGLGIGLNINTIPIVSVGVGVGIDYGIYLLSRLCEEYRVAGDYSFAVPEKAIRTTGKAIFFTATTMIAGVIFWYFLSSLRFQAEMGLLLAVVMLVNMIGALLLIPCLVYIFKPKFLGKAGLLVRE